MLVARHILLTHSVDVNERTVEGRRRHVNACVMRDRRLAFNKRLNILAIIPSTYYAYRDMDIVCDAGSCSCTALRIIILYTIVEIQCVVLALLTKTSAYFSKV